LLALGFGIFGQRQKVTLGGSLGFLGLINPLPLFLLIVWSFHDYDEQNPLLLRLDVIRWNL